MLAAASRLAGGGGFCVNSVRMLQNRDGVDLSGLRAPLNVACLNLCYPLFFCRLLLPVWVSLERRSRARAREVREGKGRQTALLRPVNRSKTGCSGGRNQNTAGRVLMPPPRRPVFAMPPPEWCPGWRQRPRPDPGT